MTKKDQNQYKYLQTDYKMSEKMLNDLEETQHNSSKEKNIKPQRRQKP